MNVYRHWGERARLVLLFLAGSLLKITNHLRSAIKIESAVTS